MPEWGLLVDFSVGVAGMVLSILGLILSISFRPMVRWMRYYFISCFIILIVYTLSVAIGNFAQIYHYPFLLKPGIFMESLSSSLLMPLLTAYMLQLVGKKRWKNPLFIAVMTLWAVYFVLLVYTQFTTVIYSIGADGIYRRGPLYPLLLIPPAAIMLLNLLGLLQMREKLTRRQFYAMFVYLAAPLAGMILQIFYYGLLLVAYGTIAGALAMFVFILSEQMNTSIRQARENAEKEFDLKVLQMRPHFIYNAMTSIYYLVDTDPQAAKETIRDFSQYLHRNFSAVVKTEQVPFEEELAHTRAYLAIEQVRFGDRLKVVYDMPHTVFCLPPLTLEPIVENAVKHGMDPDCEPLCILIRTRATDDGSEITIENNGADLKAMEPDSDGVGLSSVRKRLELMCGGTLRIRPREGGGAVATMWIPDK
ncbi:MAG: histidine kinase [Blautia sp.]|nr:histidine kinase [Blautia sp.]